MTTLADRLRAAIDAEEARVTPPASKPYDEEWEPIDDAVEDWRNRDLRVIVAHRKILDLHAPVEVRTHGQVPGTVLQCDHCSDLCHSRSGLACDEPVDAVYPCETIKLFAEAYGVEA